jgi:hypothetical protein
LPNFLILKPIKICRLYLGVQNPPEKAKTRLLNKLNVFNKEFEKANVD